MARVRIRSLIDVGLVLDMSLYRLIAERAALERMGAGEWIERHLVDLFNEEER